MSQGERSQLQPVPSDGPLPLQAALWGTTSNYSFTVPKRNEDLAIDVS